jgi:hypothetical protein
MAFCMGGTCAACGGTGQRCCFTAPACITGDYCDPGTTNCLVCTPPNTVCGGTSCVNLQTDGNNCGSCGHMCMGGRTCTAGHCG